MDPYHTYPPLTSSDAGPRHRRPARRVAGALLLLALLGSLLVPGNAFNASAPWLFNLPWLNLVSSSAPSAPDAAAHAQAESPEQAVKQVVERANAMQV